MVDRNYVLSVMKSKTVTIDQFNYDTLSCPPISSMFDQQDIYRLYQIASSIRYSARLEFKYKEIDKIMRSRGFVKFAAGTNRLVYRPVEDDTFLVKVAYDKVAIQDNVREYQNQFLLKPFCCKIFEVAGAGVIATVERVNPITSREEYYSIAEDVFTLINDFLVGEYVLDDIGSHYFMNIGLRKGFGPVVIDYPYIYRLDGKKLFCTKPDSNSESAKCDGIIDYDDGFNHLYCTKCGAYYKAAELSEDIKENKVALIKPKGEFKMKVTLRGGSNNLDKEIKKEDFIEEKVIPVKTGISLKRKERKEEPIPVPKPVTPEVSVNGVPDKSKDTKEDDGEPVRVAPVIPARVEEKKTVTTPITIKNTKTESLFDTLKEAAYNVDKYLSLILNNKSCNDQPQARKEVIDLVKLVLGKVASYVVTEDLAEVVKILFDEVVRVDYETVYEDGLHNVCINLVDNRNDNVLYRGVNNFSMKVVESEVPEGEIDYEDEGPSEYEEEESTPLSGIKKFSAKILDISTIFSNESGKVLLIDDGEDYLTVDDDKLLAVTKINDMSLDYATFISTHILHNQEEIIKALSCQVAEMSEDIEDVSVNGVPEAEMEEKDKEE